MADDGAAVPAIRTAILGSCVSRDTVGHVPDRFDIVAYVARQSWISTGRPAAGVAEALVELPSPFQERMVRGDVRGDALQRLAAVADRVDVLLVDLVDERGGVVEVGGGYVTRLAELWSAGGARATAGGRHVAFGTDEHHTLWRAAAERVLAGLSAVDLLDRTLVLRTPWASATPAGDPIPVPDWMIPPEEANRRYGRYFAVLRDAGLPVVELPAELARSPHDHRWGPSPFHYGDAAYAHLADRIAHHVRGPAR